MTHTIIIPDYCPPRSNQWTGRHWAKKHRLRKECTDFITLYAMADNIPKATGRRAVKLTIGYKSIKGKLPDHDAYDKLLLDSLVNAGHLIDDSERGLAGRMEVVIKRWPRAMTWIELTDV